jgi:hypothetical protein
MTVDNQCRRKMLSLEALLDDMLLTHLVAGHPPVHELMPRYSSIEMVNTGLTFFEFYTCIYANKQEL